jgi:Tfp pilus assembly protein PilV
MKLRITNRKAGKVFPSRRIASQKGQIMIEVLVALAILGIVAVAFLTALTTTSVALIIADQKTTAESLARSELEFIGTQGYPIYDYETSVDNYTLKVYAVFIDPQTHEAQEEDEGMQEITVEVYQEDKLVNTTRNYKTER